jgi:hypothetical protein
MSALRIAGGEAILAWGVILLANPGGVGVRMFDGLKRRQAGWQQRIVATHADAYRISFGASVL